ncbi:hypothetical protein HRG_013849 [Hirsutella rhossiliensis]
MFTYGLTRLLLISALLTLATQVLTRDAGVWGGLQAFTVCPTNGGMGGRVKVGPGVRQFWIRTLAPTAKPNLAIIHPREWVPMERRLGVWLLTSVEKQKQNPKIKIKRNTYRTEDEQVGIKIRDWKTLDSAI